MLLTDRQTDRQTDRILWLDYARTFAILTVILVHATENIYVMDAAHLNDMSLQSRLFAISMFTVGRLGVPLFLFLTGYLLLDRSFDNESTCRFWRKNWLGLLLTTEVWIVIYDVFLRIFHFQHWSTNGLIKNMLFINQVHMGHMWYMPMIIGLYICIPFAARALKKINLRTIMFPFILLAFYAFGLPSYNAWGGVFHHHLDPARLDLGFSGGLYGLYLVLGLCIKRGLLQKLSTDCIEVSTFIFFTLTVLSQWFSLYHGVTYNVWYDFAPLVLCSLFLFELLSRFSAQVFRKSSYWISKNSFGIYLVHYPVLMLLKPIIAGISLIMPIKVCLLWTVVIVISVITCRVIDCSTKLGQILLYNK
ncbi:acyltransferase [Dialister succinatiphilus]|uniref:acyltransferase n=1 Tax=Dialister succinatiphilus TaxID=487173 RepID=UPI003F7F2A18